MGDERECDIGRGETGASVSCRLQYVCLIHSSRKRLGKETREKARRKTRKLHLSKHSESLIQSIITEETQEKKGQIARLRNRSTRAQSSSTEYGSTKRSVSYLMEWMGLLCTE